MASTQHSWTLDDRSRASNPGRLEVQPWPATLAFPRHFLQYAVPLVLLAGLTVAVHWLFVLALGYVGLQALYAWVRLREHFRYGCANPGVVLSRKPDLVAVYTDLRRGLKRYPAIKIVAAPLGRMTGGAPAPGTRLAAVSLYFRGEAPDHWRDIHPLLVPLVTRDRGDIERVLDSIEPEHWEELERALDEIPSPHQPGLHHVPALAERPVAPPFRATQQYPASTPSEPLQPVLPRSPVLPVTALLLLAADYWLIPSFPVAGFLALVVALAVVSTLDQKGQRALRKLGWPSHPAEGRLGGHLVALGACLGVAAEAAGLSREVVALLQKSALLIGGAGICLVWFGREAWLKELDRAQAAVVEGERRRYVRFIRIILPLALLTGLALGVYRRHGRSVPPTATPTKSPEPAEKPPPAPGQVL